MIDPLVVALAFGAIFVVELPDKTFIATLVMSTKMRPLFVWIGVGLAFLVQTAIAVGIGKAASFLPEQLIHTVAALMFVIGAIILFREARSADEDEPGQEDEFAAKADSSAHGFKVVATSFLVLFAAEWGDLSQLLTISPRRQVRRPGVRCSSAPGARCSPSPAWPSSSAGCCSSGSGSRSCTTWVRPCACPWQP